MPPFWRHCATGWALVNPRPVRLMCWMAVLFVSTFAVVAPVTMRTSIACHQRQTVRPSRVVSGWPARSRSPDLAHAHAQTNNRGHPRLLPFPRLGCRVTEEPHGPVTGVHRCPASAAPACPRPAASVPRNAGPSGPAPRRQQTPPLFWRPPVSRPPWPGCRRGCRGSAGAGGNERRCRPHRTGGQPSSAVDSPCFLRCPEPGSSVPATR
jgi:hypothetical protein